MKLEQEAKEFKRTKKKKLSAAQRSVMRVYMSSALSGLLSSGRIRSAQEAIEEAYQYAKMCVNFEKENF